ncbi:hypothetical protein BOTCAL_0233g00040 [Botryotinia calthae]|uniref:Uncharacterized protein n=1 Tax=Botryotinia calthae TaxID=38488 RepID=A0A4Y8CZQ8_9HELO|nr:hypothetical protein BOTCAL_0233g00040 [Botryotinia calthae]
MQVTPNGFLLNLSINNNRSLGDCFVLLDDHAIITALQPLHQPPPQTPTILIELRLRKGGYQMKLPAEPCWGLSLLKSLHPSIWRFEVSDTLTLKIIMIRYRIVDVK